jgi:tyrosyl-tRNA synthetase
MVISFLHSLFAISSAARLLYGFIGLLAISLLMDVQRQVELVCRGSVLEVLTQDELRLLLESNEHPSHYIGFEISGKVHLGTGLCTALKIKDFLDAQIKPTIFLADYHAWLNGKFSGDLEKIQQVAKGYFKSAMFASLLCAGIDEEKAKSVRFAMGSELYAEHGLDYWGDVLRVAQNTTKERMLRCITIMGRLSTEKTLYSSALIYPAMQVADIWALGADIAHAGMDQRKVHVLARELAPKFKKKKPIAVHSSLLASLLGPGRMDPNSSEDDKLVLGKMSKSNPDSCIFIHDSAEDISKKISKAYCPPKVADSNPIIQMAELFILPRHPLKIERPQKFGGEIEISSPKELRSLYCDGGLHPMDLKNAVCRELIEILKPARDYFAARLHLLEQIA